MIVKTHLAAIVAAMQEFLDVPPGTWRIDRIESIATPISTVPVLALMQGSLGNAWKIAGRLELMGFAGRN